jgi:branched-chain amino acid transport system permease protein
MGEKSFWVGLVALAALGPVVGQNYLLHVLILCFVWSMVVSSWDLVMGFLGVVNFAQLVFFAIGAYASAMMSIGLGVPPLAAILISGMIVACVGMLIGLPCLRLRGEYVALFTFAVHLALPSMIRQGRPIGTGGSTGLMGIPPLQIGDFTLYTINKLPWYYLSLTFGALAVYFIYFLILPSKWGRAFVAIRDSEGFARSLGVNDYKYKLIAFTISAAITGVAGAIYANYIGVVTPNILETEFFLIVMLMLSVGGMGRFPGAVLGAFVISIGNELLRGFGEYRLLLLGVAVLASVLLFPNGLITLVAKERWSRLSEQIFRFRKWSLCRG